MWSEKCSILNIYDIRLLGTVNAAATGILLKISVIHYKVDRKGAFAGNKLETNEVIR